MREALRRWTGGSLVRHRAITVEIRSVTSPGAYHVVLQSFLESRTVARVTEPYDGGPVDAPVEETTTASYWALACWQAPFTPGEKVIDVPRTSEIVDCGACDATGQASCGWCRGSGQVRCANCGGSGSLGRSETRTVTDPNGTMHFERAWTSQDCGCRMGQRACSICAGGGRVPCKRCKGSRRLRSFKQLTVEWIAPVRETILERTALPDHLIAFARGDDAAVEEADRLEPLVDDGPIRVNADVNHAINGLLAHPHVGDARLLRQRLAVRGVPVHEVTYHARGRDRRLWIYGADLRVYAPGYPIDRVRFAIVLVMIIAIITGLVVIGLR
jgi:hypothetical protein